MNDTDVCFLVAGVIAAVAGLISGFAHEPSKATRITDRLGWFAAVAVVVGFIVLFTGGAQG